jgi:hypothetical protein
MCSMRIEDPAAVEEGIAAAFAMTAPVLVDAVGSLLHRTACGVYACSVG